MDRSSFSDSNKSKSQVLWLRLLLAGLLAFCAEIVLWIDPQTRPVGEWLLLLIGYVALAAILLDFMGRYRVYDIFGVLMLAGIYGLAAGLILNPEMALFDVPRTWITRVLGAHTLMGLLALAIWLGLTAGFEGKAKSLTTENTENAEKKILPRAIVLLAVGALAAAWGAWARWSPFADDPTTYNVAPPFAGEATLIAIVSIIGIGVLRILSRASKTIDDGLDLRLGRAGLAVCFAALAGIFTYHAASGHVDSLSAVVLGMFLAICWSILWFSVRKKRIALVERIGAGGGSAYWIIAAVLFIVIGAVFYNLPRGEGTSDPISWLNVIFLGFGLVWLPTVALVIGGRAMGRQARALRL